MDNFFNEEDMRKAIINTKELDGKVVTLKIIESEKIRLLTAIDKNKKIYVLRVDQRK